ncbi:DUF6268 family outer membrane beta-barrel protein [Rapidithrix thailandica]|uniref:DUF6268 family outer membrane beta-barrel protein n=1 Tax=Rapidithrix thailandica TaxID=413964 RepID=A0AAW9RZ96_9BACT
MKKRWALPGVCHSGPSRGISFERKSTPGFQLRSISPNSQIGNGVSQVNSHSYNKFKMYIPALNTKRNKVLLGFRYSWEEFTFDKPSDLSYLPHQNLHDRHLKTLGMNMIAVHSLSETHYLAFRGAASASGLFEGWLPEESEYYTFNASLLLGKRLSDSREMGFGLYASKKFNRFSIYPLFLYNHTFNERWGVELLLPKKASLRRNFSSSTLALLTSELTGNRYYLPEIQLAEGSTNPITLQLLQWETSLSLQQAILPMLWLSVQAGFRKSFSFDIRQPHAQRGNILIDSHLPAGMFASVSLFIAPPRKKN